MLERITNLKRLKPPVWSAAFVIALSLIAIALLSACGDETKPASTPNPASTLTPASGNTSTPAIGPTPTSTPTIVPTVSTASDELRSTKERAAPTATPTIVPTVSTASDELRSTKERAAPSAIAGELAANWSMAIAHSPLICTGLLERRTGTCSTRLTAFLWRLP